MKPIRYIVGMYNDDEFITRVSYSTQDPHALKYAKQALKREDGCAIWEEIPQASGGTIKREYKSEK